MFDAVGIKPAEILLPSADVPRETWACVACDQYTSEPEYWKSVDKLVNDAPSTLRMMLPECYLKESHSYIPGIHSAMHHYLDDKKLTVAVPYGFVLCERTIAAGTRLGLVCSVDLNAYDYTEGSLPLIRPTEQTIASRLPARLEIRRGAPVELSHIMILIDDPLHSVIEPIQAKKAHLRKLYDTDLMMDGGHITGYAIEDQDDLYTIEQALMNLKTGLGENPMLLAVGDGNHSLATAKAYWNEIRSSLSEAERETHPARYALCEVINIHDPALLFEPIHRYLKNVKKQVFIESWHRYCLENGMIFKSDAGHSFTVVDDVDQEEIKIGHPDGKIPAETVQHFIDAFISEHPGTELDFIHGNAALFSLCKEKETLGILLPPVSKDTFFSDVISLGVLPRKTFSMGEAAEKRYYMECKMI